MKGEEHAVIDRPPNHRLFDPGLENSKLTPVLRKRLENNKALATNVATNAAPVINVTFGREFTDLIQGRDAANAAPQNAPPPVYTDPPIPVQHHYDLTCPTLLQVNRRQGVDMPLDMFCQQYELDDGIRDRFKQHRYKHARMFRYLTVKDMENMVFMAGEIAEVRDAIDRWSFEA